MKAHLKIKDNTSIREESDDHVSISAPDEWDEYYQQTIKVDREDAIKIIEFLQGIFQLT